jgi:hypothetical protein
MSFILLFHKLIKPSYQNPPRVLSSGPPLIYKNGLPFCSKSGAAPPNATRGMDFGLMFPNSARYFRN